MEGGATTLGLAMGRGIVSTPFYAPLKAKQPDGSYIVLTFLLSDNTRSDLQAKAA